MQTKIKHKKFCHVRKVKSVLECLHQHSSNLSIQGVSYIFQTHQSLIGRIFWSLVVSSTIMLASVWSYLMYQDWQVSPVLTTVTTTAHPVEQAWAIAIT
jgi:hypothetical protein